RLFACRPTTRRVGAVLTSRIRAAPWWAQSPTVTLRRASSPGNSPFRQERPAPSYLPPTGRVSACESIPRATSALAPALPPLPCRLAPPLNFRLALRAILPQRAPRPETQVSPAAME